MSEDQSKRISELLEFNNQFEERARVAERAIKTLTMLRPASEYHEDYGDVLWWKLPIEEPPYVGSPKDLGITVEAHTTTRIISQMDQDHDPEPVISRISAGGWPGYHTHWTPLPIPKGR